MPAFSSELQLSAVLLPALLCFFSTRFHLTHQVFEWRWLVFAAIAF